MPSEQSALSRTVHLADRLEKHIKDLNLSPGDSFLSTAEASKFLCVAGGTANRALRLLEKRGIIARRQRLGSIVADFNRTIPSNGKARFSRIHFLFQKFYLQSEGFDYEDVLLGLQEEFPDASVEHFFPDEGLEELQTTRLIETCLKSDTPIGFVLVRAPFIVQEMIERSGLPSVLFGTRPVGIDRIPCIDHDHVEAIRLVHSYALKHGCQNIMLLMRNLVLPGDVKALRFFHAISDVRTDLFFIPMGETASKHAIAEILSSDDAPDALICHTKQHVKIASKMIRATGKNIRIIGLGIYDRKDTEYFSIADALIANDMDPIQVGRQIGRILGERLKGGHPPDETVPIRLFERR